MKRSSADGKPTRPALWDAYVGHSCLAPRGSLAGRNLALDGIEKADEFAVAVALHTAADDGAVKHAERGEQSGGAAPLVGVRQGLAAPSLDRQSGLVDSGKLRVANAITTPAECQ